jgi:activating signal cointegrator 1
MKIITLTQPWATLVAIGAKRVETRSWQTSYRGEIAIHAAKGMPYGARLMCHNQPFRQYLDRIGYNGPDDLPRGAVIAIVKLQSVVPCGNVLSWISDDERAFGHYAAGRFAWVLSPYVRRLAIPIAHRGSLGLRDIPDDVRVQLVAQGIAA